MTGWLIVLFFGFALIIGIYFTWILLRTEMDGPPKPPPVGDDFGFAEKSARTPGSSVGHAVRPPASPARH